jgi:hypothetical protein
MKTEYRELLHICPAAAFYLSAHFSVAHRQRKNVTLGKNQSLTAPLRQWHCVRKKARALPFGNKISLFSLPLLTNIRTNVIINQSKEQMCRIVDGSLIWKE